VGSLESSEFLRQSKIIVEGWRARGVAARYEAIPGMNHFTIVDALSDPRSAMTRRVVDLAQMVSPL
jgi:arylformamidase